MEDFNVNEMTREDVVNLICDSLDKGILTTTYELKKNLGELDKMSSNGEISFTPIRKLLFVGDRDKDDRFFLYEELIDKKRVMGSLAARVKHNYKNLYELQRAAMNGDLRRINSRGIILYVD